jgi:hypothetical protein
MGKGRARRGFSLTKEGALVYRAIARVATIPFVAAHSTALESAILWVNEVEHIVIPIGALFVVIVVAGRILKLFAA